MTNGGDHDDSGDTSYRASLGEILRRSDPEALRVFLVSNAQSYGDEQQVQAILVQSAEELEVLMHRMILARPDLKDLHRASRQYLDQT